MEKFSFEILLLPNDPSIQPAEISEINYQQLE